MGFGQNIKELRSQKGYSQRDLANAVGTAPSTISMYEQGKREPDLKTLISIADIFNCTVDYLLDRSPYKNEGEKEEIESFAESLTLLYGQIPDEHDRRRAKNALKNTVELHKLASIDYGLFSCLEQLLKMFFAATLTIIEIIDFSNQIDQINMKDSDVTAYFNQAFRIFDTATNETLKEITRFSDKACNVLLTTFGMLGYDYFDLTFKLQADAFIKEWADKLINLD